MRLISASVSCQTMSQSVNQDLGSARALLSPSHFPMPIGFPSVGGLQYTLFFSLGCFLSYLSLSWLRTKQESTNTLPINDSLQALCRSPDSERKRQRTRKHGTDLQHKPNRGHQSDHRPSFIIMDGQRVYRREKAFDARTTWSRRVRRLPPLSCPYMYWCRRKGK